ncbi:MAG: phosphomannomutase/phosphoglucomutase [Candidatus Abyssobacteria bacterium SURF_5]|uniref:Phosphomannomutase/phosphoglucomutase n=1 Tax=Abyssobacteria bacterium (strain SURF_5) TaxID=2093360 RepID=A0A3A4NWY5_ABYX5|nr:MAG: phosphomannomutase/phosphoglucomutase [Candidatus Abyssubacteria bacterium SURF_5]
MNACSPESESLCDHLHEKGASAVNPDIFREYDIRGVADRDLADEVVGCIGKAFGTYAHSFGKKNVVIGRDCRLSSPRLHKALLSAMLSTGLNVVDVGICPTPVFYFSLHHLDKEGGMQVTGSHNPPDQNGFKVCIGKSTIFGEEIQKIRKACEIGHFVSGKGKVETYDIVPAYQKHVRENIKLDRPLRVIIDAGNGTAGPVAPKLIRDLGCEVEEMYTEMDGRFPNHHPDPTVPKYIAEIRERVKKEGFDCGIAYDGDADRLGIIDDKGDILWGDQLLILFGREILSRKPGATIISEVKSSKTLFDDIAKHGGNPIMWKTGHSLIKEKMRETKAAVAGEMSGHVFFSDRYFGFDDAIYASCRLLEILSKSRKPLSAMLADVPKMYSTPEIRSECPDDKKFQVVKELTDRFKKKKYDVVDIDGARVTFEDGWGLVRASNTQPVLVLRFEATSEKRRDEIRALIEGELKKVLG